LYSTDTVAGDHGKYRDDSSDGNPRAEASIARTRPHPPGVKR
jgi:hypothetical protein